MRQADLPDRGMAALGAEGSDSALDRDVLDGGLFVFLNKRRNRIKLLFWDRDGFLILQKRLEDIRSAVERIQMHTSPDIRLSVSNGSAYRVKPILEAVQQADQLMYLDKENRRLNDR